MLCRPAGPLITGQRSAESIVTEQSKIFPHHSRAERRAESYKSLRRALESALASSQTDDGPNVIALLRPSLLRASPSRRRADSDGAELEQRPLESSSARIGCKYVNYNHRRRRRKLIESSRRRLYLSQPAASQPSVRARIVGESRAARKPSICDNRRWPSSQSVCPTGWRSLARSARQQERERKRARARNEENKKRDARVACDVFYLLTGPLLNRCRKRGSLARSFGSRVCSAPPFLSRRCNHHQHQPAAAEPRLSSLHQAAVGPSVHCWPYRGAQSAKNFTDKSSCHRHNLIGPAVFARPPASGGGCGSLDRPTDRIRVASFERLETSRTNSAEPSRAAFERCAAASRRRFRPRKKGGRPKCPTRGIQPRIIFLG